MSLIYNTFKWRGDISQLQSDELRKQILAKCREIDAENDRMYHEACRKRIQIKSMIDEIVSPHARNRGYVPTVKKPVSVMKEYRSLIKDYQQWLDKNQAHLRREQYKQRSKQAQEELASAGYVAGEHYPATRAITTKKELLYQIEPGVWGNRMLPQPGKTHERDY